MAKTASTDADLRRRVAQACRVLGCLDITGGTMGHVSARLSDGNAIAIRGRGPAEAGVRYTTEEDIIDVDLDGRSLRSAGDGRNAPVEVHIHTEIYRRRSDVHAVVHVHAPSAVLLTICGTPLEPIYGAYDPYGLSLVLDGVPVFGRSILIERPDLGQELASALGTHQACLMRGHGMTTVGNSIEEAALAAIQLDELARTTYQSSLLGQPQAISEEDQEVFRRMHLSTAGGERQPGTPPARLASRWRYYCRYTDEAIKNSASREA